jgi:hypothetical protein
VLQRTPKLASKYEKDEALQHVQNLYCESLEKYRYTHLLWFDTPNSNAYGSLCKCSGQYFSVEFWRKTLPQNIGKKVGSFY